MESSSSYLVTVVIPTYNRAEAVCRAVRSVLDQTYSRMEVIVVDDGSTDDTQVRLRQFGDQIRVIIAKNAGASAARNRGIALAKGEFVGFLDSDDLWHRTKLDRQMKALRSLGREVGVCFTDCSFVGSTEMNSSAFEQAGLQSDSEFSLLDSPLHWVLARYPAVNIQSVVVETGLLKDVKGFDEAMVVAEDTDLIFRLALKTNFCFVASKLVEIDRTPGRSVGLMELFSQNAERMYESKHLMFKKWLALPNLEGPVFRETVRLAQRELLFDWTIKRLYRLEFQGVRASMGELTNTGESSSAIFNTLAQRLMRKLLRFGRKQ